MQTHSVANHHIHPHIGHVLVQLHDGREDSLVLVPDTAKSSLNPYGLVVGVGDEVEGVSVGDKLIFTPNAMLIQVTLGGEKLVFVKAEQILGKYVPNPVPETTDAQP